MAKKDHQLKRQEETKKRILDVAEDIISKEGLEGLSIRKITNALDYSPGIIYHYFKDKNEIVQTLVEEGYHKILSQVNSVNLSEYEPYKEIKESFTKYIKAALESPEYYKSIMLSNDPSILSKTALLEQGVSKKNLTFKILCDNIDRGIKSKQYRQLSVELTAQIIWTATFGLIIRLIIEKDISETQVDKLIDYHFNIIFKGILKGEV